MGRLKNLQISIWRNELIASLVKITESEHIKRDKLNKKIFHLTSSINVIDANSN